MKKILENKKMLFFAGVALVAIIVVVVILISLFNNAGILGGKRNPDGKKFSNEYEELNNTVSEDGKNYPTVDISSNNIMKYTTTEEVLKIFEDGGDAVIYFGYASCLYCRSAVQVLCDTAEKTELDVIYYLDVEEPSSKYQELLDVLGERFIVGEGENREIYAPSVIFVADGNIVSHNRGTLFSQEDPYTELDDSQVQGLSEIYRYGIRDVLNAMQNN